MLLGEISSEHAGSMKVHHALAYAFNLFLSIGLASVLLQLDNIQLRRILYYLFIYSAVLLWLGFFIYIFDNNRVLNALSISNFTYLRYSAWSANPNQLALFFVPMPIFMFAFWSNIFDKTRSYKLYLLIVFFALIFMGLLIRSDALLLCWVFGIIVLILCNFYISSNIDLKFSLMVVFFIILSVFLVKSFASGDLRKSARCAIPNLMHSELSCENVFIQKSNTSLGFGFGDSIQKTNIRQELWANGLDVWLKSPWIGHGPGEYSWLSTDSAVGRTNQLESHNVTIDLLTQGGLIAGLSWLIMFLFLLHDSWKKKNIYIFSVLLTIYLFSTFHNTRQPYFWFIFLYSYEVLRRKRLVFSS